MSFILIDSIEAITEKSLIGQEFKVFKVSETEFG